MVKNLPANAGFDPWVGKIPWRRKWQPTRIFLPGNSRGQRRIAGYSTCVHTSCSVVSDSSQPCGLHPARLLCPWDSPGKNTGVGCHSLLQGIFLTLGLKGVIVSFLNHPHWAVDLQTLPAKSQAGNFRHSCTLKIFRNTEVREGSAFSDCSSPTAMI